ncbi:hypothetical protein RV11_GL003245 [Enterococcus phoeniculicola]|nr:hypothetical protein RV11_GL003245 [Enterococcus phoeniculicola]
MSKKSLAVIIYYTIPSFFFFCLDESLFLYKKRISKTM